MRYTLMALTLIACGGDLSTKSDCSELNSTGTWAVTWGPAQNGCPPLPSPLPAALTLPVPASGMCATGCTCSGSWKAASPDVDKPVVCSGGISLTCGASMLNCSFSLDDNRHGSALCTTPAGNNCVYSIDTFSKQ
jgi:hypothetical protein